MAVQENTNLTTDFAKAQSIDFVNRFTGGIKKLQEMLGITRRQGLSEGSTIKTYKSSVTLADGNVAEGDLIPLSKVEKTLDKTYELAYKKYRRAVTLEAIQRSGFDQAVQEADTALLRKIQSNIRTDFASFLATGTGTAAGSTMQAVVADAWAKLQVLFEDDGAGKVIVLANPMDVSAYLGSSDITTQNAFGMTYFKAFLDVSMMFPRARSMPLFRTTSIWHTRPFPAVRSARRSTSPPMKPVWWASHTPQTTAAPTTKRSF